MFVVKPSFFMTAMALAAGFIPARNFSHVTDMARSEGMYDKGTLIPFHETDMASADGFIPAATLSLMPLTWRGGRVCMKGNLGSFHKASAGAPQNPGASTIELGNDE